ncbi:MAG: hypothetical protein ACTHKC_08595 [Candidatus Nitrosocosmicus sp.]
MVIHSDLTLPSYLSNISTCLFNWSKKVQECNGDIHGLEECTKELRECIDIAFPPSTKLEFESDKTNYMLSAVFFLTNRLAKAMIGIAEFDKIMKELEKAGIESQDREEYKIIEENKKTGLNEILAKYF